MGLFGGTLCIADLCRQSGNWHLADRKGDLHWVHAHGGMGQMIRIRYRPSFTMLFEAELPVRFSLEHAPSGLFARVLLRSVPLNFASWRMDLRQSCEAVLFLSAQLPGHGMGAGLFDDVCREMRDEVIGFHQELRDKFHYQVAGVMSGGFGTACPHTAEVRYIEPVRERVAWQPRRMLGDGESR